MDRGAWWATIHGVTKSRTRLSDFTSLHYTVLTSWWPDACVQISCHSLSHAQLVGRADESSSLLFSQAATKGYKETVVPSHSLMSTVCFCIKFPGYHPLKRGII